jgi:hypothetical protein
MWRRDHLGDVGAHGRIILKQTLKKQRVSLWTGFMWLRIVITGRIF